MSAVDDRLIRALSLYPAVFRHALHLMHHWQDAEDITQGAYIKFWRTLNGLDERADNPAVLLSIMRRMVRQAWIDEHRRRMWFKRPQTVHIEWDGDWLAIADPIINEIDDELAVAAHLACLPAYQSAVIRAVYVDGWTLADYAARAGISRELAKTRLRGGRERLRTAVVQ